MKTAAAIPIGEKLKILANYIHRNKLAMTEMANEIGIDLISLTDFMKGVHNLSMEDKEKMDEFIAKQTS